MIAGNVGLLSVVATLVTSFFRNEGDGDAAHDILARRLR